MNGFLLDTNVLSELRKGSRCNIGVRQWFDQASDLFVSVLVLGEIRQGIERIRLRDQGQARVIEKWLQLIFSEFADCILPVDEKVTDEWGRLGLRQPIPVIDGLLAATARIHDLAVVTRDERSFRTAGALFVNPFS